jgi:hypothetical protein
MLPSIFRTAWNEPPDMLEYRRLFPDTFAETYPDWDTT